MEQKDYKLEIIRILLKEKSHIRALAKKLSTNHMMIVRKIKELYQNNIVDYTEEGKNKVYYLKNTQETKQHIYIYEHYRLIQLTKRYPLLKNIISKIQNNKNIQLAIIFGSYAKEISKTKSDIDIYMETTNKKIKQEIEELNSKINVKIGKYDKNNLLIKEIAKHHVIIKGVEKYYEKHNIFE